ncbi:hypothetical protein G6F37_008290 [Rhizopus arrhizus]|nr:hypothetical protein G6F38_008507 [Rhizopus arrhizus]KAG1155713.1 hypothetical protein G6F37_008290 [Rhizopus arrhizus]
MWHTSTYIIGYFFPQTVKTIDLENTLFKIWFPIQIRVPEHLFHQLPDSNANTPCLMMAFGRLNPIQQIHDYSPAGSTPNFMLDTLDIQFCPLTLPIEAIQQYNQHNIQNPITTAIPQSPRHSLSHIPHRMRHHFTPINSIDSDQETSPASPASTTSTSSGSPTASRHPTPQPIIPPALFNIHTTQNFHQLNQNQNIQQNQITQQTNDNRQWTTNIQNNLQINTNYLQQQANVYQLVANTLQNQKKLRTPSLSPQNQNRIYSILNTIHPHINQLTDADHQEAKNRITNIIQDQKEENQLTKYTSPTSTTEDNTLDTMLNALTTPVYQYIQQASSTPTFESAQHTSPLISFNTPEHTTQSTTYNTQFENGHQSQSHQTINSSNEHQQQDFINQIYTTYSTIHQQSIDFQQQQQQTIEQQQKQHKLEKLQKKQQKKNIEKQKEKHKAKEKNNTLKQIIRKEISKGKQAIRGISIQEHQSQQRRPSPIPTTPQASSSTYFSKFHLENNKPSPRKRQRQESSPSPTEKDFFDQLEIAHKGVDILEEIHKDYTYQYIE